MVTGLSLRIIVGMRYATAIVLSLAAGLAGCARYDFEVLKPELLATRVTQTASRLQTSNMVYFMQAYENRLVMQIHNKEQAPVELVGERSFVVDPHGVSHPLRSITIAPDSYAKLILPPLRPRFEHHGFSFGVGTQVRATEPTGANEAGTKAGAADSAGHPIYLDVYEDTDAYYWDWDGTGPIRVRLTYRKVAGNAGGAEVADEFTISKVEAK